MRKTILCAALLISGLFAGYAQQNNAALRQLGALSAAMHLANRPVVDAGLHTGKMTREQAIAYHMQQEPVSEQVATSETERYMAMPAQALCYKIGELKIKTNANE